MILRIQYILEFPVIISVSSSSRTTSVLRYQTGLVLHILKVNSDEFRHVCQLEIYGYLFVEYTICKNGCHLIIFYVHLNQPYQPRLRILDLKRRLYKEMKNIKKCQPFMRKVYDGPTFWPCPREMSIQVLLMAQYLLFYSIYSTWQLANFMMFSYRISSTTARYTRAEHEATTWNDVRH